MQCLRFRPCVRRPGTCASMRRLRKRPLPQQPLYFPAVSEASCPAGAGRMSSVPARGRPLTCSPRSLPCRRRTAGIPVLSGPGSAPKKKRLERLRLAYEAGADSLEEYQQRKQEIRKKNRCPERDRKRRTGRFCFLLSFFLLEFSGAGASAEIRCSHW